MVQGWRSVNYLRIDPFCVKCAEIFCRSGGWNHLQKANQIEKLKGKLSFESSIGCKALDLLLGSELMIDYHYKLSNYI
jgi:hypothetical protein